VAVRLSVLLMARGRGKSAKKAKNPKVVEIRGANRRYLSISSQDAEDRGWQRLLSGWVACTDVVSVKPNAIGSKETCLWASASFGAELFRHTFINDLPERMGPFLPRSNMWVCTSKTVRET